MGQQIVELNCPGCGARVNTGQQLCDWCHKPVIISTFNSVYSMPMPIINKYAGAYRKALGENPDNIELNNSIAMCYLKLKLYDKALLAFEKAMEDNFDNSETFFYAAVCLFGGKRPFQAKKNVVDKALQYLESAVMIEPRGVYYYFMAYIKHDFYYLKKLNVKPNYSECLEQAKLAGGVANADLVMLSQIMGCSVTV